MFPCAHSLTDRVNVEQSSFSSSDHFVIWTLCFGHCECLVISRIDSAIPSNQENHYEIIVIRHSRRAGLSRKTSYM